jgi:SAM-dependent methyltransferase
MPPVATGSFVLSKIYTMTGTTKNYLQKEIGNTILPKANNSWFEKWFDSSFYHKLYANRDDKEAAGFINELLGELQPASHSRMLDLGCGNGRHSKWLASKGFDVTGIDLAASSIRDAKRYESATLRFYRQDMRVPFGKNAFDYVFNFFTSFGYFNNPDDDNKVVCNISTALKPGGLLVMDYINAAYAEKRLIASEEKEIDGIVYHISRWTDENYIFKKISIEEQLFGRPLEYTERVKKFSLHDFKKLFKNNGLRLTNVFGDYQLNGYDSEASPRIIMIAKKITYESNII